MAADLSNLPPTLIILAENYELRREGQIYVKVEGTLGLKRLLPMNIS